MIPRYPVYIPTKGRWRTPMTAKALAADGVPFRFVVEPQEAAAYEALFGADHVLVLPFSNLGQGSIPARNWIKEHATDEGHERHWQLDDNIRQFFRRYKGERLPCHAGAALAVTEDFVDRYENVAIAGLGYDMFQPDGLPLPPFYLNTHVYSCTLVLNSTPHRWRGRYNEDTDMCLQVLTDGWCTVQMNIFSAKKIATMRMKGGNTDELYRDDGRANMSRSLERRWPHVVETKRRWGRPAHVVRDAWKRFDTPLRRKPGFDPEKVDGSKYAMKVVELEPVRSEALRKLIEGYDGGP